MKFKTGKVLKACKIESISFASFALKQNVDFLGIHILQKKDIGKHKELVEFIKSKNGNVVILTKIDEENYIEEIVKMYRPKGLQFHFEVKPELVSVIKNKFPDLLLFGVITNQSTFLDFKSISNLFDYIIYDSSYLGGTNIRTSYNYIDQFPEELRNKTLLAGGITVEAIKALDYLGACGYDIQSYFRSGNGTNYKNFEKVCDILKFPRRNMLSVSLTDLALREINKIGTYYNDSNVEYHLDYSPGTLYPNFNTISNSIEEKQEYLLQLPYSIHLFIKDIDELREKIKKLNEKYPLNIVRIFVQYSKDLSRSFFSEKNPYVSNAENFLYKDVSEKESQVFIDKVCDIKIVPSVFFKDLSHFLENNNISILSIIVPQYDDTEKLKSFIDFFISKKEILKGKEIWFDRSLNLKYINYLQKNLGSGFNYIIGKEVISDWRKINVIHEQILK